MTSQYETIRSFERDFGPYAKFATTEGDALLASYVGNREAQRRILDEVVWVELGDRLPEGCVDSALQESIIAQ